MGFQNSLLLKKYCSRGFIYAIVRLTTAVVGLMMLVRVGADDPPFKTDVEASA